MNIVLLGAPGSGKGTQAKKLQEEFGLAHISTGDLLRDAVKNGTNLGIKAKQYMDAGELVPDSLVIELVKEALAELEGGFILDGFPRNTAQATMLDSELLDMGLALNAAILVDVDSDSIVERLSKRRVCRSCGYIGTVDDKSCPNDGGEMYQRDDDVPETIKERLDVYASKTAPLIDYYQGKNILLSLDGQKSPDEVYASLRESLHL